MGTTLVVGINRVDHPRRRKKYINAVVEVYKYILCTGRIRQSDRHRFTEEWRKLSSYARLNGR